ncbi:MAG: hypothetical protein IKI12_02735 [Lachnospiraceae bacterium]|nr:hypothetical protein [Lachnospiraceae bacterium]
MDYFVKTRLELELEGAYGPYFERKAKDEVDHMQRYADNGHILVDSDGAAYWDTNWEKNGKYLKEDAAEKLSFTDVIFDREATRKARAAYSKAIKPKNKRSKAR